MTVIEINVCNTIFDDEECLEDAKEEKKKTRMFCTLAKNRSKGRYRFRLYSHT